MTIHKIATRLAEYWRTAQYTEAYKELYADDAISIEPENAPGLQNVKGLENLIKKGEQFSSMIEEMHNIYATEPIVAGNFIALGIGMDATMKGVGRRNMEVLTVYEVKDGKILREQFFY